MTILPELRDGLVQPAAGWHAAAAALEPFGSVGIERIHRRNSVR